MQLGRRRFLISAAVFAGFARESAAREAPSHRILEAFRDALATARRTNLRRVREYRRRGAFPEYLNGDPTGVPRIAHRLFTHRPVFIDERGRSCAVAYLMQRSGWAEEAAAIARTNVNVKVENVHARIHARIAAGRISIEEIAQR